MVHATWLADRKVRNIQPENGTREKEQKVGKDAAWLPLRSIPCWPPVTPSLVYEVFCEKKVDAEQPYFFFSIPETPCVDWVTWPNPPESTTWCYRGEVFGFNGEMVPGGISGLEEDLQELEYQSTA